MKKSLSLFGTLLIFGLAHAQPNPPVPTNVTAQVFSGDNPRVVVSWQATSGPWYFNVYRSMGDSLHFTRLGQLDRRSFEDHGVIGGRTYYYNVRSVVSNDSGVRIEGERYARINRDVEEIGRCQVNQEAGNTDARR